VKFAHLLLLIALLCRPSMADWQPDPDDELQLRGYATLELFREVEGNEFEYMLAESYAFVVFPRVSRTALLIGWASGHGFLVEDGRFAGYVRQRRLSIGFQLGHQKQGQVLLFRDPETVATFKTGRLEFTPQASAHAKKTRSAADGSFSSNVAVFSLSLSGLSVEAAVGGSKYKFTPSTNQPVPD